MKHTIRNLFALTMALVMFVSCALPALAEEEKKPLTSRPDQLVQEEIEAVYSLDTGDQTYHRVTGSDVDTLRKEINKLSLSKGAPPDTDKGGEYGFLVRMIDGSKCTYYVSETEMFCGDGYFKTNQKQRDAMIELCKKYNDAYAGSPRWLVYMNADYMTDFTCEGWDSHAIGYIDLNSKDSAALVTLDRALKALTVQPDKTITQTDKTKAPWKAKSRMAVTIQFSTDISYQIEIGEQTLSIWSSDRKTNLHYTLSDKGQVDALRDAMKTEAIRLNGYKK